MDYVNNRHLRHLDVAKGIAILLVVLGHSFPENIYSNSNYIGIIANIIYSFIYSFHMPVFFYISGYLFCKDLNKDKKIVLKKKATRLLIPYLSFSLLYVPLRMFLSKMANSDYSGNYWKILIGISPNGGVWFLYVLFLLFIISSLFNRNKDTNLLAGFVVSLIIAVLYHLDLLNIEYSVVRYLLKFAVYFELGLFASYYENKMNFRKHCKTVPLMLVLIIVFSIYYHSKFKPLLIITGIIGIATVISASYNLSHSSVLEHMGKRSMDIYLLHGPIMVAVRWLMMKTTKCEIIISMSMLSLSLILSLLVSSVLHKYSITDAICFGNISRLKK